MRVTKTILATGWRVREVPKPDSSPSTALPWMPATVPGHVHLDLMKAGVISDPFYRMMERSAGWVDEADWVYENTFTLETLPANPILKFHGIDTVADITLNDEPIGSVDNMLVEHEIPVAGKLRVGENVLRVVIHSALKVGRARRAAWEEAGNETMPHDWFVWGARSFVRKAQYMYGWDWGPEPVSGGIWKQVELIDVPVARITDWRYETELSPDGKAIIRFVVDIEQQVSNVQEPLVLRACLLHKGISPQRLGEDGWSRRVKTEPVLIPVPAEERVQLSVEIVDPEPDLWNPNGLGEPIRYSAMISLHKEGWGYIDGRTCAVGLRTIELIQEPDINASGCSFVFRVNGKDIFIKGANWIPTDSFPSRAENLERDIRAASEAGFNMLRVWGGGLYESDEFYKLCDNLGILVWQDFPYACAYYPDTGEYAEAAREEAARAIRRLRNHPCLALWCGNNENSMMYDMKWGDVVPHRLMGEKLYDEVLPAVVAEEDPGRAYIPSSPTGGDDPNSQDFGDRHNWDVWHGVGDWTHYPEDDSRFVSEFGFASSCGLAAWDTCLEETDKSPHSAVVRWHDKTRKGYDVYMGYVALHYPKPQTLEDLVYYSQCNQADALKCGVEHYRRRKGRCWGTLFWQLNDCWPVQSWSVIDYAGEAKAAYYACKRFYAPILVSLVRHEGSVEAHLTSDLMEPVSGSLTLRIETFDGETLLEQSAAVEVGPNGTAAVATMPLDTAAGRERDVVVTVSFAADGAAAVENTLFLAEPKDLRLADAGLHVSAKDGSVTVRASRFAPYVWLALQTEKGEPPAQWSDNYFHLRAGETREVTLTADKVLTAAEIMGRLTVRSL